MFATLVGGYPFGPLPGATEDFGGVREGWARGAVDAGAFEAALESYLATIAVEQFRSGLDLVEDAFAGHPGGSLEGLARALLDGTLTGDGLAQAWRRIDGLSEAGTKAVVPGPASLAMWAGSDPWGRPDGRVVELVQLALDALAAAGCPMVLLVDPVLARPAGDRAGWRAVADAHEAACRDHVERIHLCLSIPGGAPDPAGIPVLVAGPFASYHVDVTAGAAAWRYLGAVPPERGVIVGAARADSEETDDEEVLVWAATLAAERGGRGAVRVGIAPSGSLAGIDRHRARRKIERLGSALRLARMGPIGDVARALQPDPAAASIPALRRLIADHDAVLSPIDRPRSP